MADGRKSNGTKGTVLTRVDSLLTPRWDPLSRGVPISRSPGRYYFTCSRVHFSVNAYQFISKSSASSNTCREMPP
ncbi:hypothetical protein E5288_WYG012956 [Bos mutus]|uniref:Uncharacterized protein n=1 Tax=Bos mutus TaxID=72004 RepID=A0A6B0REY1_9CETA|nr:hypothetical protein [Bos mutus]